MRFFRIHDHGVPGALAHATVSLAAEGPGCAPAAARELELRAVTAAVPGLPSRILATRRFDPAAGTEQSIRLVCR